MTDSWEQTYKESFTYKVSKDLDENARGHSWKRDDMLFPDGYVPVDIFAYYGGHHNGPVCESCGYYFCQHCTGVLEACTRPVGGLVEKLAEVERLKRSGT